MGESLADMHGLTPIAETNAHADPQAVYRRLREEWGEVAPVELQPGVNAWLVMGHPELVHVLRNERTFSKDSRRWKPYTDGLIPEESPLATFVEHRPTAYWADGDEHRRYREPLVEAVESLKLRQVTHQIRDVCADLISAFSERGHADLLLEYGMTIPAVVVGRMLGLDLETARIMHGALIEVFAGDAKAGKEKLEVILRDLVRARTDQPTNDMASVITHHPNIKDEDEAANGLALIIAMSAEATMNWIAGSLVLMLTDPRFAGRIRGGRLGIDDALDEVLWVDTPFPNAPARYATRDTRLGGQAIRRGDALVMSYAAANGDPRVLGGAQWDGLGNRAHLSWAAGPHVCPAQVPARLIVRESVEAVLHHLPGLRLTLRPEELGRIASTWSRCPATIPVQFTPVTIHPHHALPPKRQIFIRNGSEVPVLLTPASARRGKGTAGPPPQGPVPEYSPIPEYTQLEKQYGRVPGRHARSYPARRDQRVRRSPGRVPATP